MSGCDCLVSSRYDPTAVSSSPAGQEYSGVLAVDKPDGVSSFGVVSSIKRRLKPGKIGHCGTLDPFATGVLLICLNQATRIVDQLLDQEKTYRFTVRFGIETDTMDRTGATIRESEDSPVSVEELQLAVASFLGVQTQVVPRYAAVKIQGRRLYDLSRKGIEVDLPSREVTIHELGLLDFYWPFASFIARCSKGTYIRRLASDMGARLGCGAHVTELRRVASGGFGLEHAVSLSELEVMIIEGTWMRRLMPMSEALSHLPSIIVEDVDVLRRLRHGTIEENWEADHRDSFPQLGGPVRIIDRSDNLTALWWPNPASPDDKRLRVLVGADCP